MTKLVVGVRAQGGRASRRAGTRRVEAYRWLGAGAFTLGFGAVLACGSGIAHADDGGKSAASSHSTSGAPTGHAPKAVTNSAPSRPKTAAAAVKSTSSGSSVRAVTAVSASSVSAQRFVPDVAISILGHTLLQSGSATATSGAWSIAVAVGANSTAYAVGGIFNFAVAAGTNSTAGAGGRDGLGDDGAGSFDLAVDIGNNAGSANGVAATLGNFNTAIDIGNNNGFLLGALAFNGNHNTAINVGNNNGSASGAGAFQGNGNTAITIGNNTNSGTSETFGGGAQAGQGNHNFALQLGSNNGDGAVTPYGYGPIAGGANGTTGNNNFAAVFGDNGTALAGISFDHDAAIIFGNGLIALADTADNFGIQRWFNFL
ncbi:hypothetical protein [Mycolicibacterium sphagni]|uniref:hypothetical protein n=1 Tax=Mycolicibacterium sphagni TaxID=1786 RepID=UPI0010550483|nr:hypothetical protein [Mycolicibacterium sphagni]